MTPAKAQQTLKQWRDELQFVADIVLDCEMEPEELTALLERRQQAIGRIQALDAAVKSLNSEMTCNWSDEERLIVSTFVNQGRDIASKICRSDSQVIDIAEKKKDEILRLLKSTVLSRGYNTSNQDQKEKPPAIVDDNA